MAATPVRTTVVGGMSANWYADDDGVIHVLSFRRESEGSTTRFAVALPLGECFDRVPRALWDQIRYEFESRRSAGRE